MAVVGLIAAFCYPKYASFFRNHKSIVHRINPSNLLAASSRVGNQYYQANQPLQPVVFCIGDMGGGKGFYIRSNSWFGGDTQILKMGRIPYMLKMQYKTLFMTTKGKTPPWGNEVAEFLAEKL